jgi:hypothetical protein
MTYLDFDIDTYVNPYIPPPTILAHLPKPLAHALGYRRTPRVKLPSVIIYLWSFIGAFCGVSLIAGVFLTSHTLQRYNSPLIVPSFGASAILLFQTIDSPLSQPRNFVFGHTLSALTGVGITKLFEMNPDFEHLRWLAGALSCGIASVAMGVTKTVHPPAGATALMAATDPMISALGWWFIPCVLINCGLMLAAALIINNLHRHYPAYWWSPAPVGKRFTTHNPDSLQRKKSRTSTLRERDPSTAIAGLAGEANPYLEAGIEEKAGACEREPAGRILVTARGVEIPEELHLAEDEEATLRLLQQRLEWIHKVGSAEG